MKKKKNKYINFEYEISSVKRMQLWIKWNTFQVCYSKFATRDSKKVCQNVIVCGHNLFIVALGDVSQMVNQSALPII